jgi:hypothetical protein
MMNAEKAFEIDLISCENGRRDFLSGALGGTRKMTR